MGPDTITTNEHWTLPGESGCDTDQTWKFSNVAQTSIEST